MGFDQYHVHLLHFLFMFFHRNLINFHFILLTVHAEPHYASAPFAHYDYDSYDNHYAYEPHAHQYSHY